MYSVDMSGKTVVVTGATAGIGEATALVLAAMGAKVLLVSRDQRRGDATLQKIREEIPGADVTFFQADLSAQAAIRQLGADLRRQYDRIDVLVNNAGALFAERQESVDGLEMSFALNHLSYFLLTNELLELLKGSAPARIVNVASGIYTLGTINFDDLQSKRDYNRMRAYAQSKLANILWTNELARRLEGTNITANSLHPGGVASNFAQNNTDVLSTIVRNIFWLISVSPEKGAETSIYLASSPEVAGVTGTYFVKKKPVALRPKALDAVVAKKLWEVSEQLTEQSVVATSY